MAEQQQQPAAPTPKQLAGVEGTRATPAPNLYDATPQDRWLADQAELRRQDPHSDPNIVLTKDAAGNLVRYEKIIGADGQPKIGKRIDPPEGDQQPGERRTQLAAADGDDQRIMVGDVEYTAAELRDAVAHMAETNLRKASVPETPNGYKLELPKDLVLPAGAQFKVANINDPVKGPGLRAAMEWAHSKGFSQTDFSEMLGVYAAATGGEQLQLANAARVERDALGPAGQVRVDAIMQYVKAHYPAASKSVAATLVTKAQVEMFEDIITRRTVGSGAPFSQRGRELDDGTVDDKTYNSWNYTQKKEYAERQSVRRAGNQ